MPVYARQFPSQFSQSTLRAPEVTMTFNLRNVIHTGVWDQQIVSPHPLGKEQFPTPSIVSFAMPLI